MGKKYAYTSIEKWMEAQKVTATDLANRMGVSRQTLAYWLRNGDTFPKYAIDRIIEITGMTYEEAFRTE